jgi:hypothetical protein
MLKTTYVSYADLKLLPIAKSLLRYLTSTFVSSERFGEFIDQLETTAYHRTNKLASY